MLMKGRDLGIAAETRVLKELHRRGWHLLDRNWSCRWGELDLLLIKGRRLLLVEVKGRRTPVWGTRAVMSAKRRRLGRAFSCWRAQHPERADCLLQVAVAVVPLPPSNGPVRWFPLEQLC